MYPTLLTFALKSPESESDEIPFSLSTASKKNNFIVIRFLFLQRMI